MAQFKRLILALLVVVTISENSFGEEQEKYRIKYVNSFNAMISGQPLGWVDKIVTDSSNEEVYLLDSYNGRIVVVDTIGTFLYEFNYSLEGIGRVQSFDVDFKTGDLYIATSHSLYVLNFRGKLKSVIFSAALHKDLGLYSIQDIDFSRTDEGPKIFIGENRKGRLFSINPDGSDLKIISSDDVYIQNYKSLRFVDDNFVILDSARFTVIRIDKQGKFQHSFGRLSSLLGGFSMPIGLTVDPRTRRIFVVDSNRSMLICFDWNGKALFEIGGPSIFKSPRAVAVDEEGRMYIADTSGFIRIFRVIEEAFDLSAGGESTDADTGDDSYDKDSTMQNEDVFSDDKADNQNEEPAFLDESVPEPADGKTVEDISGGLEEGESGFVDDLNVDDEPSFDDEM